MENILDVTQSLVQISVIISIVGVSISLLLLLYRTVKGPTNPDRAVALDTIGVNIMAMAGLIAVYLVTTKANDVVLLIGILLFIGNVGLAKFLEKGVIIERDMD
ncbi:monovalent cation/H+ antiporter complex subunit F [Halobacillus shinanisalinarum]|uniref:Monovalent cation/H+ antiporter complex subunit F n=1 Tax=Halobacillus shinanisalinarum TaxID=2932258 RepID=A0ABY4H0W5_9BACI|nr:monovalent cation/H+ antiporter complex subunit F [Halobacillus shinanisalinarum]UOQ93813.1 monovalent cation/H+ antiporter complex subunit F [Halobacillus shinanisalinarum]